MINAAEAVIDSYSIFIRQKDLAGDEDISARKVKDIVGSSRSYVSESLIDNNGKKYKISIPNPIISAKQNRGGRVSTTFRVANLTEAGHIIAAAESNPDKRSMPILWGRFAYQDNNHMIKERMESALTQYVASRYICSLQKKPVKKVCNYYILARLALHEYIYRSTSKTSKYKSGDIAESIKVSVENYINNYKKHFNAMLDIIQDKLDKPFLQPVIKAISEINHKNLQT